MRPVSGPINPWRVTPAVKVLLIANLVAYVVELLVTRWLGIPHLLQHLALTPDRVLSLPIPEVWQVATYMFLHDPVDPMHLLFNMLVLWMFGGLLETRWGSRAFTRFYLLSGIGAGVGIVLVGMLFGQSSVMTMGASGALFGMTVAFGLLYPDLQVYLMFMIPVRGKTLVLILIGIQFLILLARVPGISVVGHLSGAAVGYLLVTGYWRPSRLTRRFRPRGPKPPQNKRSKAEHLRLVSDRDKKEREDDDRGGNGAGKYLH